MAKFIEMIPDTCPICKGTTQAIKNEGTEEATYEDCEHCEATGKVLIRVELDDGKPN